MTPEERQMLDALADRIRSAPQQAPDAEADQAIRQLVAGRPDTTYLLAQTVLMQDFALRNAQAQIADLQGQLQAAQQQPRSSGSFLGNLFGSHGPASSVPPGTTAPSSGPWTRSAPPQPDYVPQPVAYSTGYAPVVMQPSQTSSFLRSAATTAAGIAGGALLFEGINSLFSGHPGGYMGAGMGGWGPGWGGGGGDFGPRESISETTINNNYYDDRPSDAPEHHQDTSYQPDQNFDQGGGYQDASDTSTDFGSSDDFSGGGDSGGGGSDYA